MTTPTPPEPEHRGLGIPQGPRFHLPTPPPGPAAPPPPTPPGGGPRLLTTVLAAIAVVLVAATTLGGGILFLRSLGSVQPSPTATPSPPATAPTPKPPAYAWLPKLARSEVTSPLLQAGYTCEQQPLAGLPGLTATSCEQATTPPFVCEIFLRARDEYHVWEVSARYFDRDETQAPDATGTQRCTELGVRLALQHAAAQQEQVLAFLNTNRGQEQAGGKVGSLQLWAEDDAYSRFSDITAGYR